jgi:hypothetical protein
MRVFRPYKTGSLRTNAPREELMSAADQSNREAQSTADLLVPGEPAADAVARMMNAVSQFTLTECACIGPNVDCSRRILVLESGMLCTLFIEKLETAQSLSARPAANALARTIQCEGFSGQYSQSGNQVGQCCVCQVFRSAIPKIPNSFRGSGVITQDSLKNSLSPVIHIRTTQGATQRERNPKSMLDTPDPADHMGLLRNPNRMKIVSSP